MRAIRFQESFALCTALLLVASAASAVNDYTFVGRLTANRGKNTNVPLAGNTNCGSLTFVSAGIVRGANTQPNAVLTPAFDWKTGKDLGCVKHNANVVLKTTGKGVGGAFTLPSKAFRLPYPKDRAPAFYMAATDIPVAEIKFFPPVVQIATSVSITAPPKTRIDYGGTQGTMNGGTAAHAAFRKFKAGAWATQTGRAGPKFTWCPPAVGALSGPGNPDCANPTPPPPYPGFAGIIKYNGTTNSFGGTMSYVTHQASGVGSIAFFIPGVFVGFNPFGGGEELATGRGYADYNMITLPSGVRLKKKATTPGTTLGKRYIGPVLGSQNVIGMVGGSPAGIQGGGKVYTWGFPFTTMTVVQRATKGGVATTFTAKGWDCAGTMQGPACSVTPTRGLPNNPSLVQRNISLVAGSVSISRFPTGDTPAVNLANMQILPEPGTTLQLLAGVIGLLGVASWRSRRVR